MNRRNALARMAGIGGALALMGPGRAFAQQPGGSLVTPITTTLFNAAGAAVGTLTGTLTTTQFIVQNGQVFAVGTFTGTVKDLAGNVVTTLTNLPVQLPLLGGAANAKCTILDLTVGPIFLNLLGLVVQTNTIHLTITAVPGAGNLLGNLLCAVANLLNNPGNPLGGIANLLNRILGLLP